MPDVEIEHSVIVLTKILCKNNGKPEHQTGVKAFDVRYALEGAGGALGPWIVVTLTSSKKSTIHGLTPAGTYQFQIRALGKLGYTDWLDTKTFVAF